MADITMCSGGKSMEGPCPKREYCYRFNATPNEFRQSYYVIAPFERYEGQIICRDFWDTREVE